jgi:hypothetical protein
MLIGLGKMVKKITSNFTLLASRILGFTTIAGGGSGYYTTTVGTNKDVMVMYSAWTGWVSYSFDDGATWNMSFQLEGTSGDLSQFAVNDKGILVIRPSQTGDQRVYVSTDGLTYETIMVGQSTTLIGKITLVGDAFVVSDTTGVFWWSIDGINWNSAEGYQDDVLSSTNYNGERLYWITNPSSTAVRVSNNVMNGFKNTIPLPFNGGNPVYAQEGLYYTASSNRKRIFRTSFGESYATLGSGSDWTGVEFIDTLGNPTESLPTNNSIVETHFISIKTEEQTQSFSAAIVYTDETDNQTYIAYSTNIYNWKIVSTGITSLDAVEVFVGDYGKFLISYRVTNGRRLDAFGIQGQRGAVTANTTIAQATPDVLDEWSIVDGSQRAQVSWVNNEWVMIGNTPGRLLRSSTPEGGQGFHDSVYMPSTTLAGGGNFSPMKYINGNYVTAFYGQYLFSHGAKVFSSPSYSGPWRLAVLPLGNYTNGPTAQKIDTLVEIQTAIGDQNNDTAEILAPINVYTVPAGKVTTLEQISLINGTATPLTYDLGILQPWETLTQPNSIKWDEPLSGSATSNLARTDVLIAGETVTILPSTVDALTARVYGTEANSLFDINLTAYIADPTVPDKNFNFSGLQASCIAIDGKVIFVLGDFGTAFYDLMAQFPEGFNNTSFSGKTVILKGFEDVNPQLENYQATLLKTTRLSGIYGQSYLYVDLNITTEEPDGTSSFGNPTSYPALNKGLLSILS